MNLRAKAAAALLTTGIAASALVAVPGTAAADSAKDCPKGAICFYSGPNQSGKLKKKVWANWSGSLTGIRSYFNNGKPQPGLDHVQLKYSYWVHGHYRSVSQCVHYGASEGKGNIGYANDDHGYSNATVKGVKWRGEC
ncbi:hypothetical protein GTW43_24810 [Streptomyces sp. SID5785]|uniref:peptidase inhibitor family I36 protein n=1 Tax=Streptomyces sp. SID5785 TaxID=2690309 RepID=UPI001360BA6F|nr:peptidase inhibitor family I36 protein [Streptomyces sp. SID5785]MZD08276.1 hypothetical protein [Streptomyces sp. SID5785]